MWIPAGQWRQEQKILTDDPLNRGQFNQVGIRDVTIRGAGMWHSRLYALTPPHEAGGINHPHEGNFGFDIDRNTQISDIAIFGSGTIRGGDGNHEGGVGLDGRFGKGTKITNVRIEHADVGVRAGPARLSTLVGAVVLARAVEDSRPSDEILAAARAALPPARAR